MQAAGMCTWRLAAHASGLGGLPALGQHVTAHYVSPPAGVVYTMGHVASGPWSITAKHWGLGFAPRATTTVCVAWGKSLPLLPQFAYLESGDDHRVACGAPRRVHTVSAQQVFGMGLACETRTFPEPTLYVVQELLASAGVGKHCSLVSPGHHPGPWLPPAAVLSRQRLNVVSGSWVGLMCSSLRAALRSKENSPKAVSKGFPLFCVWCLRPVRKT